MKKFVIGVFAVLASLSLGGCVHDGSAKSAMQSDKSQVELRSIQSRAFDTKDQDKMLRTIIATLQDLGFVIDKADEDLGTVSATKLKGYNLRMTVTVRQRGEKQTLVRANAQYNVTTVETPEPYQDFFNALGKSAFLTAHEVE